MEKFPSTYPLPLHEQENGKTQLYKEHHPNTYTELQTMYSIIQMDWEG